MYSLFSSDVRQLNSLYNRPQFSFVFLYGRYGTGKTRLVREFCREKRTLFFSTPEATPDRQLQAFHHEVSRCLKPSKIPAAFADWEQAFSCVSDLSFTHRTVLVLDEFQRLIQNVPDFLDALTHAVHHIFPAGKVFLILTCSAPAYAKKLMEAPVTPPFDAITARACLDSVPFYTCQPHLSVYTPAEQAVLYGITGGLPANLERLDQNRTARENILELFFYPDAPLLFAPQTYLHTELREISTYNQLLEIIANGCTRLADIAAAARTGTNKCAKYLSTLIELGILRKEFPAIGDLQKKVRYVFSDQMLRFWYRFIYPNTSGILSGDGVRIYEEEVLPHMHTYLLPVFEILCAAYLERLADTGQTPFVYHHTGAWWCGGTKREPFFRIPLVASDAAHTVLGTCHCDHAPAGISCLEDLMRPLEPFGDKKRYCCIFSASGFTPELKEAAAEKDNVWLIDLEDITA